MEPFQELYFGRIMGSKKNILNKKYVLFHDTFDEERPFQPSLFNSGVTFNYLKGYLSSFVNSNHGCEIDLINGIPERISEKFSNKEFITPLDENELESLLFEVSPFKKRIKERVKTLK